MKNNNWFNQNLLSYLLEDSIRSAWERVSVTKKKLTADVSLGNPFYPPPKKIINLLIKKLRVSYGPRFLAYMDNAGYYETRWAVAKDLRKQGLFPKELNENHIVMTVGATGGLNCVLNALLNPNEEVILLNPYFVEFPKYIANHKGTVKIATLTPPYFDLEVKCIEKIISPKTKAIILNTPNNPTGKVYSASKIKALASFLKKKNNQFGRPIFLISDEVYRDIVYPPHHFVSPCCFYPYSIMVYSFSKSLNLPGERIGYVAIHPQADKNSILFNLIKTANRALGYTNAPALIQKIIPDILPVKLNLKNYQNSRAQLASALEKAGFSFQIPEGAFYFWVKIPTAEKRFFSSAKRAGLLVVNSEPFGVHGYFRMAFCQDPQTIRLACQKILMLAKSL